MNEIAHKYSTSCKLISNIMPQRKVHLQISKISTNRRLNARFIS